MTVQGTAVERRMGRYGGQRSLVFFVGVHICISGNLLASVRITWGVWIRAAAPRLHAHLAHDIARDVSLSVVYCEDIVLEPTHVP